MGSVAERHHRHRKEKRQAVATDFSPAAASFSFTLRSLLGSIHMKSLCIYIYLFISQNVNY